MINEFVNGYWNFSADNYQIGDTGDYDGCYMLQIGDTGVLLKSYEVLEDAEHDKIVEACNILNQVPVKWSNVYEKDMQDIVDHYVSLTEYMTKEIERRDQLLSAMHQWLVGYMDTPGQYNRNGATFLINEYEKLIEE
jgi:hypothetical protein